MPERAAQPLSADPLFEAAAGVDAQGMYTAQARSPNEPDLILTITYPNMAALDRSEESEALVARVVGSIAVQSKGGIDREAMRDVLGGELLRELVLK